MNMDNIKPGLNVRGKDRGCGFSHELALGETQAPDPTGSQCYQHQMAGYTRAWGQGH